MTVSPDASWLACGTETSEIIMIPITDDTIGYQLRDSCGSITALLFSSGGDRLYSSAIEGGVNEWDLTTRKGKRIVEEPAGIKAMDFSQDNTMMAALTNEGRVLYWQTDSPGRQNSLETGDRIITAHKFIPGGHRLATGDNFGAIDLWNTSARLNEGNIEGHLSAIKYIAFDSTDGQMLTADDAR